MRILLILMVCICGLTAFSQTLPFPQFLTNQADNLTNYEQVTNVCWRPIVRYTNKEIEFFSLTNSFQYSIRKSKDLEWWKSADVVSFTNHPATNTAYSNMWWNKVTVRENINDDHWFYACTSMLNPVIIKR